jgi:hypothetical protein
MNNLKTIYQFAKYYHSKGLVPLPLVAPVGERDKYPCIEGWQQRTLASEFTAKQFTARNNIGILCGEASNILVLDIDNKKGGMDIYRRLLQEQGIVNESNLTLVQTTGSGGKHLVFKYHPQFGTSTEVIKFNNEPVGWDIRSNGGQIVVHPSLHPTTKLKYQFEGGIVDLDKRVQHMPMWLETILDCGGVVEHEGRLVADYERAIMLEQQRAARPQQRDVEHPPTEFNTLCRYVELLAKPRWENYTQWVKAWEFGTKPTVATRD